MDFSTLNKEQLYAATYSGKHLLVLAGAGTGKTRTIIARACHLIENGEDPHRIKILSFTKKSANEIVARIKTESSNNPQAKYLSGSTFHSWCYEIIQRHATAFQLKEYTCIDEDDRESAFKLIMGKLYGKKRLKLQDVAIKPEMLISIYSFSVNTRKNLTDSIRVKMEISGDSPDDIEMIQKVRDICENVIRGYLEYKRQRRYLDYDDLLSVVAKTLKANHQLQYSVASQYSHILVDEAQDTNPLQWLLLENFFTECHIFCVGDDAQSIYAFRGADFKSIHSFKERVPGGEVCQLNQNYRSTQELLDLSNWVLSRSPLNYDKHLVGVRGSGAKPVMHLLMSGGYQEAEEVTNMIQKGVAEGKKYHDYMVLTRSSYAARPTEAACLKKNIPYVLYGGTALMRSAHIRDVISALRIISNYHDELAWMRYLLLWDGIGEVAAAKIISVALEATSLPNSVEAIRQMLPKGTLPYDTLKTLIAYSSPAEAINIALSNMSAIMEKKYDHWDYRRRDFQALSVVAEKFLDISSFIAEYVLDPVADVTLKVQAKGPEDAVVISTIHSAKGLEADTCFIINVNPKTYPSPMAVTDDEVEEERRCLYVALTRAQNHLHIMSILESCYGDFRIGARAEHKTDPSLSGKIDSIRLATPKEREPGKPPCHIYCIDNGGPVCLFVKEEDFQRDYLFVDPAQRIKDAYFFNGLPEDLVEYKKDSRIPQRSIGRSSTVTGPTGPSFLGDFDFE